MFKNLSITKILIVLSLILIMPGGFFAWQRGWINFWTADSKDENKSENISDLAYLKLIPELAGFISQKTYLVLFQNNLELRSTGGYIGNFGIVKVKNGKIASLEIFDAPAYDYSHINGFINPPAPIRDYLFVANWQLRDSNWSPDFPAAAKQAEYFYQLEGGKERLDGIIAINAALLPDLLKLTGPIYLPQFDKTFESATALYELEYEVEKGYYFRGLPRIDRKSAFKDLVNEAINQLTKNDIWSWVELKDFVLQELKKKNIQVYIKNEKTQKDIFELGWAGEVNQDYANDYLMTVEYNMLGKKSNYYVERAINYSVDLSGARPKAKLSIVFEHSNKVIDWFNDNYKTYLRVFAAKGSELISVSGANSEVKTEEDLNKTVFGNYLVVKAGETKTIDYEYYLPDNLKPADEYRILVQKQSGIGQIPLTIDIKYDIIKTYHIEKIIETDWEAVIFFKKQ